MGELDELVQRLEALVATVEEFDAAQRSVVFELLDGFDTLHRAALSRLAEGIGPGVLDRLRSDPPVAWLLDAYGIGVDQRAAAEMALNVIRPYVHSHGGRVDLLSAEEGVIRLRMAGACAGCTGSAATLGERIEESLREHVPGFARIEVEEDGAAPHPPPGPTLLQISMGPPR